MKKFNVTGLCVAAEDYMVDISDKLKIIHDMVNRGYYFTINRARQYGKTTTLSLLQKKLAGEYICVRISFEGLGDESFISPKAFCLSFMELVQRALEFTNVPEEYKINWVNKNIESFKDLSVHITKMCTSVRFVLMIDEIDKSSNNRIYIHFLGMLRDKYLLRKDGMDYTFHSVILAGVYDIRNIKLKLINEGAYTPSLAEGEIYNSPWNIAVRFGVDMSFNPAEIATMLHDYENDHHTGMDIMAISNEIHTYTSGYPFLVSRICQCIDEEINKDWTSDGIRNAVKIILDERNTLFDDIYKNLENNQKLHTLIYDIVFLGIDYTYNLGNPEIALGVMYGLLSKNENNIAVSNRIFETLISNYFISKNETAGHKNKITGVLREDVVENGCFNMRLCLEKFALHYTEIYSESNLPFLEKHGRLLFLTYLKPLINGNGFYHIESETRNQRRMDLIVDYGRDQFILELKIWRGEAYMLSAYDQLLEYMDIKNASEGYLLTFDFRKDKKKIQKPKWVAVRGKRIFNVTV